MLFFVGFTFSFVSFAFAFTFVPMRNGMYVVCLPNCCLCCLKACGYYKGKDQDKDKDKGRNEDCECCACCSCRKICKKKEINPILALHDSRDYPQDRPEPFWTQKLNWEQEERRKLLYGKDYDAEKWVPGRNCPPFR